MGTVVKLPYDEERHPMFDPHADVHEAVVINIETARLRRALRLLPPIERHVLERRYGIGGLELTVRELADELGIATSTAWQIEQRGLERLREHYGLKEAA